MYASQNAISQFGSRSLHMVGVVEGGCVGNNVGATVAVAAVGRKRTGSNTKVSRLRLAASSSSRWAFCNKPPPIFLAIVFVSYPYLIYNAGAALRYKQAIHPVLIFYPLLILAYARAYNLSKRKL